MLVMILQVPSFILVGPNIFLSILLSNTESFWIIFSLRTHVSQPYVTIGLIIDQYNFSLDFLDTNLLPYLYLFININQLDALNFL